MKKLLMPFIAAFLIINISCRQTPGDNLKGKEDVDGVIQTSTLDAAGMNERVINELIDSVKTGFYPNRHSLLIYKNDKLVLEEYFTGEDQNWGNDLGVVQHSDTVLHDIRSISKSVVSACIGIAIGQGKIKGIDQKVFDFFEDYEEYKNGGKEELTIKHLLTMTSGLEWNEEIPYDNPQNSEIQMSDAADPVGFVLSRKLVYAPGSTWVYNGGTTALLAEIIERATGKNVYEFAKEYLFGPMGIDRSQWTVIPGTGTPAAASGLRLRSRDLLKFGILYQHNGKWKGAQLLEKSWVEQSLSSQISRPGGGGYGFQFWILNDTIHGQPMEWPAAVGNGDQRICFDRKNNLLMVTTAGNYNKWNIKNNANAIFRRIYYSFQSK
jgi:CubicO group peptidase (beta-lactamase class C family)